MSNYSKIYWLTRLDYLQGFVITLAILIGFALIIHGILKYLEGTEFIKGWKRTASIIAVIFFSLIACLIPSKNEAILIMAGGKAMDFVQSDSSLSKMPYQTTQIISDFLENQIKSLKEKK